MWPATTFLIFPVVIGVLVEYFTDVNGLADFSPAFFISAAFQLTICFLIFILPLHVGGNTFRYEVSVDPPGRGYTDEIAQKYNVTVEMIVLSIFAVFAGIAWSIEQVNFQFNYNSTCTCHCQTCDLIS